MTNFKKTFLVLFKGIIGILFPPLCVVCGEYLDGDRIGAVCAGCLEKIVVFRYPQKVNGLIVRAAADYRDRRLRKIVHSLKYGGIKPAASDLGDLLVKHLYFENISPERTIIVPVPLHPSKERKRGFNQTELIARAAGRKLGIPVETKVLRRIKKTEPQMEIEDCEERTKNLANAFAPGKANGLATGKTVIIVDDVLTSGSTMKEAMKEIRKMKPEKIIPVVIAMAG